MVKSQQVRKRGELSQLDKEHLFKKILCEKKGGEVVETTKTLFFKGDEWFKPVFPPSSRIQEELSHIDTYGVKLFDIPK